jgi:hypothetical protein
MTDHQDYHQEGIHQNESSSSIPLPCMPGVLLLERMIFCCSLRLVLTKVWHHVFVRLLGKEKKAKK